MFESQSIQKESKKLETGKLSNARELFSSGKWGRLLRKCKHFLLNSYTRIVCTSNQIESEKNMERHIYLKEFLIHA